MTEEERSNDEQEERSDDEQEERSDDERQKKRRRWRLRLDSVKAEWPVSGGLTLGGSGFVGLVVVVLAWWIFHQPQSQVQPTAAEVQREPISSAGPNPFMSPVGHDQPYITAVANTGGAFSGNTPGLFGETGDKPSCDAQSLVTNLQADPTKAEAWADALGLQSQDIPSYVTSLVPVVLRSHTAVTSYGYADGHFLAYPAVLQAGTAVFINSYGEPKAKCFSGNPLTAAISYPQTTYVGPPWQDFQPTSITVIQRTPTVVNNYTMVNVVNRTTIYRPAPRPQQPDDNWYCKKHADSDKCKLATSPSTGTSGISENSSGTNTSGSSGKTSGSSGTSSSTGTSGTSGTSSSGTSGPIVK
jgi:uncharacterized membrane protein YgcG